MPYDIHTLFAIEDAVKDIRNRLEQKISVSHNTDMYQGLITAYSIVSQYKQALADLINAENKKMEESYNESLSIR